MKSNIGEGDIGKRSGVSIRSYAAVVAPHKTAEAIEASEVDIQLEIDESERATIQTTLETRPINTKRKYDAYQKEYIQWCTAREFRDRDTVTGGKRHLFLSSMVIGRKLKMNSEKTIGGSTVCGCTSHKFESAPSNTSREATHKKRPDADYCYKEEELRRQRNWLPVGWIFFCGSVPANLQHFFSLDDIRGLTAFLLSHFGLLRGENIRDLEFADMFSQNLDGKGYQSCIALVILVQHGKTITFGKLQHVGYMRNKDIHICPVGAAAMSFFQLFHIDREPFPCFRNPQDWYATKLLLGRQRDKSIFYETHKASYEAVFKYLGLNFNKKTHINRQQVVSEVDSPTVRALPRVQAEQHTLPHMYPSPSSMASSLRNVDVRVFGTWEENLAARGFLQLLRYLRSVFLQDTAVLFDHLPSRFQQHQILGDAFHHFRARALEVAATAKSPV
ncbi:hypothetical protein P3T76_010147 [Phytophthora citrophthora]|uniref:Ndc10 domain-containing protein n=1 Tax=Phytophthora citrophthora TaxID=4793 RepID=A0AAD9LID7_9STRA|nr:hypothetical protein P3T76_010147 [Phytophthora citrophthora]